MRDLVAQRCLPRSAGNPDPTAARGHHVELRRCRAARSRTYDAHPGNHIRDDSSGELAALSYSLLVRVDRRDGPGQSAATGFVCDLCEGEVPEPTNDGQDRYTFKIRGRSPAFTTRHTAERQCSSKRGLDKVRSSRAEARAGAPRQAFETRCVKVRRSDPTPSGTLVTRSCHPVHLPGGRPFLPGAGTTRSTGSTRRSDLRRRGLRLASTRNINGIWTSSCSCEHASEGRLRGGCEKNPCGLSRPRGASPTWTGFKALSAPTSDVGSTAGHPRQPSELSRPQVAGPAQSARRPAPTTLLQQDHSSPKATWNVQVLGFTASITSIEVGEFDDGPRVRSKRSTLARGSTGGGHPSTCVTLRPRTLSGRNRVPEDIRSSGSADTSSSPTRETGVRQGHRISPAKSAPQPTVATDADRHGRIDFALNNRAV